MSANMKMNEETFQNKYSLNNFFNCFTNCWLIYCIYLTQCIYRIIYLTYFLFIYYSNTFDILLMSSQLTGRLVFTELSSTVKVRSDTTVMSTRGETDKG